MFDINKFYNAAINGESFDESELITFIKSFKNLILWGAGNCGNEVSKKLLQMGFNITCFWDLRADEIGELNNIPVKPVFEGNFLPDETLVIICITNGALGDLWQDKKLTQNGYLHYLQGVRLYEALICPFKKDNKLSHEICINNPTCSLCNCKRYINMIPRNQAINDSREIVLQVLTIILTRACSLDCTYCGQFIGNYPKEARSTLFDIKLVKQDFDRFLKNVDAVGMVSIIGGEAFLHPGLTEFVQHCLKHKNFGALNITTNGVCKMTEEMLVQMKDPRVKITFSDYTRFLNGKQKALFSKNVAIAKSSGINFSIGVPLWMSPPELVKTDNTDYKDDYLCNLKKNCKEARICSAIVDRHFVPCTKTEITRGLNLLNFPDDYVDLSFEDNIRDRIYRCINKPYYETCRYCSTKGGGIFIPAGEQRIRRTQNETN